MVMHILLILLSEALVFMTAYSRVITFPIYAPGDGTNGNLQLLGTVEWDGQVDPGKVLRKSCNDLFYQQESSCRSIVNYFILQTEQIIGGDADLHTYVGSLVINPSNFAQYAAWGQLELKLDIQSVSELNQCSIISIPSESTHIQYQIDTLCGDLKLAGIECRALSFEIFNYVDASYFRAGGLTLSNYLRGMHLQLDLAYAHFPVTLQDAKTGALGRFYFHTDTQYAVPSACQFCMDHALDRAGCKVFVDYADKQLQAYFGSVYAGQLWALQYVLSALETISQQPSRPPHPPSHRFGLLQQQQQGLHQQGVIADFVEIGTSNFDTVSQHVSDTDNFVGFAVEPARHYLDSLPVRRGVKKVHAAIVTAPTTSSSSNSDGAVVDTTVDLYYVPEEVIDRLGLFYYLKGCNSIGGYHPGHLELNVKQHVVVDKVPTLTLTAFLRGEKIRRIRLLKIDAEGYDLTIMDELYRHMTQQRAEPQLHVDRIMFESNDDEQREVIQALIRNFIVLGYRVVMTGENTVLENIKPI